jgi:sugar diacid utilization regulator
VTATVPDFDGSTPLAAIAVRIAARREELGRRTVERYRAEIADYRLVEDEDVLAEVHAFALENVDALTSALQGGNEVLLADHLERTRAAARRRLHQRVSLESFLHAGRVWARIAWDAVLAAAGDGPGEREAALAVAGRVLALLDMVSTAGTAAYLDELSDRGLLRHDLLAALLAGDGDRERTRRRAAALRIRLDEHYVVVVVRAPGARAAQARPQPLAGQTEIDRVVEATRSRLAPSAGTLIVGMRHGDLVVLYPVTGPAEIEDVKADCAALLAALDADVGVGMSGWHEGIAAIASAYDEAMDAVDIAVVLGIRDRAVTLDEVIVDHMLRASSHADRILMRTLRPVIDYDRAHRAELVTTLRTYLATRLNLTRSSERLSVHPNTVVYRLRRVRELSGRDPRSPDDLLVLSLALRLQDMRYGHGARSGPAGNGRAPLE